MGSKKSRKKRSERKNLRKTCLQSSHLVLLQYEMEVPMRLLFCLLLLMAQPVSASADQVLYCVDELATGFFKKDGEYIEGSFKREKRTVKVLGEYTGVILDNTRFNCSESMFIKGVFGCGPAVLPPHSPSLSFRVNSKTLRYVYIISSGEGVLSGGEVPVGPPGRAATVHVSMSDATGDSAIIEFVDGEMTIWHDRSYQIMTNEPTYDRQLAILDYWQAVNPREFMPGTVRASDRFVRAHFYINAVEQSADARTAASAVFSVIRQASVPWGISIADQPNLSTTRWRVVADHFERRYYVESVASPSIFWVDLDNLDLSEGAAVMKLDLGVDMERIMSGESSASFETAEPFTFQPAD